MFQRLEIDATYGFYGSVWLYRASHRCMSAVLAELAWTGILPVQLSVLHG